MKALSVKQPFAMYIAEGEKTIEIRSWKTDYRGSLLICASLSESDWWWKDGEQMLLLPAGCALAVVDLVDVRRARKSDGEHAVCEVPAGSFAWIFENPRIVEPVKVLNKLRLFDVHDSIIRVLREDEDVFNFPPPQGERKPGRRSIIVDLGD